MWNFDGSWFLVFEIPAECNTILFNFQGWSLILSGISMGKVTNLKIPGIFFKNVLNHSPPPHPPPTPPLLILFGFFWNSPTQRRECVYINLFNLEQNIFHNYPKQSKQTKHCWKEVFAKEGFPCMVLYLNWRFIFFASLQEENQNQWKVLIWWKRKMIETW